ncbi:MAG: hydantoinase B/oxoprolinase family protein [Syntrophomonadaceae bacterium]|nr:hydantoinase B/oxoprolinase family protein [Syntrophomonadaceae bacterium]
MRTDPATLEIMHSYFNSIASGMGHVIERTSYTTFVRESADFATALATPSGEFFVYPRTVGVTIFLGLSLEKAVKACGELEPGDIVITNDPYSTDGLATHLTDVHVFKPIFANGKLISYAWSFVHCSDIGGLVPASISPQATDVHQEGLRIPPVKIYKCGVINEDVRTLFMANSRIPQLNYGDLNAMVAAVNTAETRLLNMVEKFGVDAVEMAMDDLLEQGEERSRQVIAQIPDGRYSFADYLDDDMVSDVPIRLAVDVTVSKSDILLDFSNCDPQVSTAFNLVTNGTRHSFLFQGLINYIISSDPFIPVNGGLTHPIKIIAPRGTLVNAEYPAAVGLRHPIVMRLYNAVLGALAQALPEDVPAAGGGQAAIVVLSTPNELTGSRKVAVVEPMGGGGGGQSDMDGVDGIDHSSGFLKNTPIESLEQDADIIVHRYELMPDTAGVGLHRGGHAVRLDFEIIKPGSIVTARGMERLRFQPWGLAGGKAGALGKVVMNPGLPTEKYLPKINILTPRTGDILSICSPGGGGWGDPMQRNPRLVLREVEDGFLTIDQALERYGVVIRRTPDGDLIVDDQATFDLRRQAVHAEDELWDLGQARKIYENRWTPEASNTLARLLQTLTPSQRSYRKHDIHTRSRLLETQVILPDTVQKIWLEIESGHKEDER